MNTSEWDSTRATLMRAEHAGVSRHIIAKLERGDHDPKLSTVVGLCRAFEIPLTIGTDLHTPK